MLNKLRTLVKFCIVGVIATAVHYGIYYLLYRYIGINISYALGYLISFCLNFYLSAVFTFKTTMTFHRGIGFAVSHAVNFGLHMLFLNVFNHYFVIDQRFIPFLVYSIVIPINYLMVHFVFTSKKL